MEKSLTGKKVVITGATGGIGQAIALGLAMQGASVALMGRNTKKLEKLAERIWNLSCANPVLLPGDLASPEYISAAAEKAAHELGGIDILINNAGTAHSTPFEEVSQEQYDLIMNTNVKAPFLLCQKVLPYLRQSESATIINIASVTAHTGYPFQSVYSASKHALLGFSKSLAKEVYKDNIRVHVISPGGVYTDMIKTARPDLTSEGMMLPEDIADIIVFMLKHRNNAVIDEICLHRAAKEPFM